MQHNPAGEANVSSATQEIPWILWKPKAHYCVNNSLWLHPILSQMNPFHIGQSYFFKTPLNNIPIYAFGLQVVSFSRVFQFNPCIT